LGDAKVFSVRLDRKVRGVPACDDALILYDAEVPRRDRVSGYDDHVVFP